MTYPSDDEYYRIESEWKHDHGRLHFDTSATRRSKKKKTNDYSLIFILKTWRFLCILISLLIAVKNNYDKHTFIVLHKLHYKSIVLILNIRYMAKQVLTTRVISAAFLS